jgi:hypothetical protein
LTPLNSKRTRDQCERFFGHLAHRVISLVNATGGFEGIAKPQPQGAAEKEGCICETL